MRLPFLPLIAIAWLAAAPAWSLNIEDRDKTAPTVLEQAQTTEQEPKQDGDDPTALVREGAQKIIDALRFFIDKIPQYHAPEVNDNGDIIIRRKHPDREPDEKKKEDDEGPKKI